MLNTFYGDLNSEAGLCIRHPKTSHILFQNENSKQFCGDRLNTLCRLCSAEKKEHGTRQGAVHFVQSRSIRGVLYQLVRLKTSSQKVTLMFPLENKIPSHIDMQLLTTREQEIIQLVLAGAANEDIAKRLFISKSTLKTHLNNIYRKIPSLKPSSKN